MEMPSTPPTSGGATSQLSALENDAFAPHGQIDCWREDHMLHFRATGPFNRELFEDFVRAQRELFLLDPPKPPWGSVVTVIGSALATLEGLESLEQFLNAPRPRRMNASATAYVMGPKVEGRLIMVPVFRRIYAGIQVPFEVFDDARTARGWVQGVLDTVGRK